MNNKVYNILKYMTQIILPAIGTLYVTLVGIWNLPYGEAISGTIMGIDTFLGTVLVISTNNYNKKKGDKMAVEFKEEEEKIISSNADEIIIKPEGKIYEDPFDIPNREE